MNETDAEIEVRIRASIERDLSDPEFVAHLNRALDDMRHGRYMSTRVALLPLPSWAKRALAFIENRTSPRQRKARLAILRHGAAMTPLTVRPAGTHGSPGARSSRSDADQQGEPNGQSANPLGSRTVEDP